MKWLAALLALSTAGAMTLTVAGFGARFHPWLELCCHFRLQYVAAFVSLVIGLVAVKRMRWAMVAALGLVLNATVVLPWYFGADEANGGAPTLKVLLSNVHSSNHRTRALLELVAREKPDVIALLEVDHDWQRRLAPLRKRYPHFVERPQLGNFGIALYSKRPLIKARVLRFSADDLPSIGATIKTRSGRPVYVLATHPVPPLHSVTSARLRDQHINAMAEHLRRACKRGCVALGDLNATQFSPIYQALVERAFLLSSRRGRGVLPTWPTGLWPMMIPLDHVLHSRQLRTLRCDVGPDIGSDHRPLVATFGWKIPSNRAGTH